MPSASEPTEIATIGVYGHTLEQFLAALHGARVSLLIDVRQRRGVRGPQYAWANSLRLQRTLAEAGISYLHRRDLAPTTELRRLQYREDDRLGEGKRSRTRLAGGYVEGYTQEILQRADLDSLVDVLPAPGHLAALLCVERDAPACHRSLICGRLAERYGIGAMHLG